MAKGSLRVNGIIVDTDGEITASTGDSIVIREDDGSAVITVDTNGNVGINTTAPGAQFDIRGPAGTGSASASVLRMSTAETSVVDADQLGRIEFIAPLEAGGTDAILVGASIHAEADDTFAADNNSTELVFSTGASEAAAEKMRITSDGKVGIGTTAPTGLLSIRGSADNAELQALTLTNSDWASGETSQSVAIQFMIRRTGTTDAVAGKILAGKDNDYDDTAAVDSHLAFYTAINDSQNERMRISSNGNVGIGTSSPASDVGVSRVLEVVDSSTTGIKLTATGGVSMEMYASSTVGYIENTTNHPMVFRINTTEVMRINSSGKVGIGTTSPGELLSVIQDVNSDNVCIEIGKDAALGNYTSSSYIKFLGSQSGVGTDRTWSIGNVGSTIGFQFTYIGDRANAPSSGTDIMTLMTDGKVGIGTSSPSYVLSISQETTPTDFSDPIMSLGGSGTDSYASGAIHAIGFNYSESSVPAVAIGYEPTTVSGQTKGQLHFATRDVTTATAPTKRMTIDTDGHVGIGTTAPFSLFHIHGTSASDRFTLSTNNLTQDLYAFKIYHKYGTHSAGSSAALVTLALGAVGQVNIHANHNSGGNMYSYLVSYTTNVKMLTSIASLSGYAPSTSSFSLVSDQIVMASSSYPRGVSTTLFLSIGTATML